MRTGAFLILSLAATSAMAGEPEVKNQEYYDRQVAESMQAMTNELQNMTGEMVKYMNAFNKAVGESMPQLSQNMSEALKSMRPVAENMQKTAEDFAKNINAQLQTAAPATPKSENTYKPEAIKPVLAIDDDNHIRSDNNAVQNNHSELNAAIDEELQILQQNHTAQTPQAKIKLFPSSIE